MDADPYLEPSRPRSACGRFKPRGYRRGLSPEQLATIRRLRDWAWLWDHVEQQRARRWAEVLR